VTVDDVTMQTIVQDSYGPADRWRLAEIALPDIADSEVLVKVHAAGIDRGTWHAMTGLPYLGGCTSGCASRKGRFPGLTSPAPSWRLART
jgi:NADPH:quinone reductase-like Zn-dependent oxidoreductase